MHGHTYMVHFVLGCVDLVIRTWKWCRVQVQSQIDILQIRVRSFFNPILALRQIIHEIKSIMERRHFLQSAALLSAFGLPTDFLQAESAESNDPIKPFLLPAEPPLAHNGGMGLKVWVRNGSTNGLFSSVECAVAPKLMGPAPHAHKELDELMFVLEGTASVLLGDEIVEIKAGGWHMRPRMIKHTFFNASEEPLRFIDMYFNQPFEEYLEAIFHKLTPENGYPSGSTQKSAEIKRLSEHFGLIRYPDSDEQKKQIMREYNLR